VDSVQFARTNGELSGSATMSDLKRLALVVLAQEDGLQVRLVGFQDDEARPCLRLRVNGAIRLACQRCLEPLSLEFSSDRSFILVEREDDMTELADEDDAIESLMADGELDVLVLVEDEILLQIPIAPAHDPGKCTPPEWRGQNGKSSNAFSVLGALTDTKD
jgi:uncharacterized protein